MCECYPCRLQRWHKNASAHRKRGTPFHEPRPVKPQGPVWMCDKGAKRWGLLREIPPAERSDDELDRRALETLDRPEKWCAR